MDNFEKNLDKAVDNYEKGFEKVDKVLEKANRGINRLYIGCVAILGNLFLGAFCLWGIYGASTAIQWELNGEAAPATVIELKESNDEKLGRRYTSIVEYEVNGQTYSAEVGEPSIPAEHQVGETLTVRYRRDDPRVVTVDSWGERWALPLILIPSMTLAALLLNFVAYKGWRRGEIPDEMMHEA
jgi:uncharacterized protein DUF3592